MCSSGRAGAGGRETGNRGPENAISPMSTECQQLVERYQSSPVHDRVQLFDSVILYLKRAQGKGRHDIVSAALPRLIGPELDYTSAQSLLRLYRRARPHLPGTLYKTKLAVLSSFTAEQLVGLVDLFLFAAGVDADIYQADYGVFR